MANNYLLYNFNTTTTEYPSGYDPTKLNLGHLMSKNTDENGEVYVSPLEPKFIRGYEVVKNAPYSYSYVLNSLGSLKYNDDTTWLFYAGGGTQGAIPKRVFLASHKKSTNEFSEIGSISINYTPNSTHNAYSITPSMEKHTGGTVTVIGNIVTGSGTTWLDDGVCVGNRIGFESTNSDNITIWYQVSSVDSNTGITISQEFATDGNPSNLNITGSTQYVIEDFRLIYANYGGGTISVRGIALAKGLRYELFKISPTTIPAGTTIDNLRACYRILDSATTSATFSPFGLILMDKTSLTDQDLYTLSLPSSNSSIQKFNIRAPLTLTAGRSNSPFLFTTGTQANGGTNTGGYIPMTTDFNGNFYITNYTRISRVPISGITNGSTTFIVDAMVENPPGTSTTYPLSSQLIQSQYLRNVNKFYVSHIQGTIRNYLTSYSVGGQFERPVHINDQIEQSTYLVSKFDNLTTNFSTSLLYSHYNENGLLFLVRDVTSDDNVIYSLPIEADKDFHTITNSCIITPELFTLSATSYNRIYLNTESYFNKDKRFAISRENCDVYYRTSGITTDIGTWILLPDNGEISGSSTSIQFKLTFRTAGLYSIPCKVKGIVLSYQGNDIPSPTTFYDPSIGNTNLSSNIFSWRQNSLFNNEIPNLNIDIYDSSNNLLLTDSVSGSTNGVWEYSSNNGLSWNSWSYSANTINNYIRYSATTLSASGLIVKPILYI